MFQSYPTERFENKVEVFVRMRCHVGCTQKRLSLRYGRWNHCVYEYAFVQKIMPHFKTGSHGHSDYWNDGCLALEDIEPKGLESVSHVIRNLPQSIETFWLFDQNLKAFENRGNGRRRH